MKVTKLFSVLIFLAICVAAHSVREWKKYENGKVESHKKRVLRLTKNHTAESDLKRAQRILHSHRSEKMNRQQNDDSAKQETADELISWDAHRKNKERHHKIEKKLRSHSVGDTKRESSDSVTQEEPRKDQAGDSNKKDDSTSTKTKKKRSKPEGSNSILWRRAKKEAENFKIQKILEHQAQLGLDKRDSRISRKKAKHQKKKMVIDKMEGNEKAKQLWKEAFRGENRITNVKV